MSRKDQDATEEQAAPQNEEQPLEDCLEKEKDSWIWIWKSRFTLMWHWRAVITVYLSGRAQIKFQSSCVVLPNLQTCGWWSRIKTLPENSVVGVIQDKIWYMMWCDMIWDDMIWYPGYRMQEISSLPRTPTHALVPKLASVLLHCVCPGACPWCCGRCIGGHKVEGGSQHHVGHFMPPNFCKRFLASLGKLPSWCMY